MFDVSGESLEADNNSNKQKAMLVDILEKWIIPIFAILLLTMHCYMGN